MEKCAVSLPFGRMDSQAVLASDNSVLYLGGGGTGEVLTGRKVLAYHHVGHDAAGYWEVLPESAPVYCFAMVLYQNHLLLCGGKDGWSNKCTRQLTLLENKKRWTRPLPAMPTARSLACAASRGSLVAVAGGDDDNLNRLDVVELFDGERNQWFAADPLPSPCSTMKSLVHDGRWYLTGGVGHGQTIKCVYYTELESLVSSVMHSSSTRASAWKSLPSNLPYERSSIAVVGGHLLAVGGQHSGQPVPAVFVYLPVTGTWVHVADMPMACCRTCSVVLPSGDLLVIGGKTAIERHSRLVHKAGADFRRTLKSVIEKVLASVEYVMRPEDLATLRDMSKDQCLLYFLELLDEKKREVSQLQETLKALQKNKQFMEREDVRLKEKLTQAEKGAKGEDADETDSPVLSDRDLERLSKGVRKASHAWKDIGERLGFQHNELDAITRKNGCTEEHHYLKELLNRWLKWAPPNHDLPTEMQLVECLRKAGEERVAYDMQNAKTFFFS